MLKQAGEIAGPPSKLQLRGFQFPLSQSTGSTHQTHRDIAEEMKQTQGGENEHQRKETED
jgi:hypothetical protein